MEHENTFFRKVKSNKQTTIRKRVERKSSSSNDSDVSDKGEMIEATSVAERRQKLRKKNMIYTTNKKRKMDLENLADTSSESSSSEKQITEKFTPDVRFSSTGQTGRQGPSDMGATARSEIDTDASIDAQAQFERNQQMLKDAEALEATSSKKVYKGMALYGAKLKEDTVKGNASSGLNRKGPIRATQFMRANVRWDYAPDICKDYKETGFCTFGDSCKFMHDRGDYKHGWEIERDYEASKLKEAAKDDEFLIPSDEDEEKGNLPHHCFICRESFKSPVITKCKHYFCEACAISQYRKSKRCAVCNVKIDGVFSTAKDIIAKMGVKKEKKKEDDSENSDEEQEKEEVSALPMDENFEQVEKEPVVTRRRC